MLGGCEAPVVQRLQVVCQVVDPARRILGLGHQVLGFRVEGSRLRA